MVQFRASSYRPVNGTRIGIAVGSLDQKDAAADRSGTVSGVTILGLNRQLDAAGSYFSDFGGGFFYKNSLAIEPEIGTNHSKIVSIFWHILFWSCNIVVDKRHFSGQTLIID